MLRLTAGLLLAASLAAAADRWVELRSGPFEVLSDAGERAGRERLAQLEQLRNGIEQVMGLVGLQPVWPIRILVLRSSRSRPVSPALVRDAYLGAVRPSGPWPPETFRECARLLIEANPARLPPGLEAGLAEVFSTLEVEGGRVTLGRPPAPAARSLDWARMHMLTVSPDYFGKLRTLIFNLSHGVEPEVAFRNAFGRSPGEIERLAQAYLAAGGFPTVPLFSRAIRMDKDLPATPASPSRTALAAADLLFAAGRTEEACVAYRELLNDAEASRDALAGLGLAALAAGREAEARDWLGRAVEAGDGARAHYEYGRLEQDDAKALASLKQAAALNPRWGAPHFEMARRQPSPGLRIPLLAEAARREPRNSVYWRELAANQEAEGLFIDAARSWASAELAAGPEEKEEIRRIREEAEIRRRRQEEAERQRAAEEKEREIQRLKEKSIASIQAALEKARQEHPAEPSTGEVVPWWDDPRPRAKVTGLLRRVDCSGKQAVLVIEREPGKTVRLLVRAPDQVVILGGGEKALACGAQKPPRSIVVEYIPRADGKMGSEGDAALVEFR